MWVAEIFGFIGGGLGTLQGIPQAWRIYRMKTGYGVSISSWILMLLRMSTWMGYGFYIASPSIMVSNLIGAFTSALVVAAMRPNQLRAWLWIVPVIALCGFLVQILPLVVTSVILVLLTLSRVPQLIRSIANAKAGKVTAVSISALALGIGSMLAWGTYAFMVNDPLVLYTTLLAMAMMLTIGTLEIATNRIAQRRLDAAAGEPAI
ncbi:MAG: hypothetical protein RIR88_96 [Actinomycetota bacterium]|jgi:uncharacterized protein with PQ loop repeat